MELPDLPDRYGRSPAPVDGSRTCAAGRLAVPAPAWRPSAPAQHAVRAAVLVFLAALVVDGGAAWGAPADAASACKAVRGWLRHEARLLSVPAGAGIARIDTYTDERGEPAYHVAYLDPAGFVVVPADDQVEPIVALAEAGAYDPSPGNPLGALVSRDLPGRLARARAGAADPAAVAIHAAARRKWQRLAAEADDPPAFDAEATTLSDIRVAPLTQSRWGQGSVGGYPCYNYYTPDQDVAGCVATALAQVLRFWQRPAAGIGARTFSIRVDGISQSVQTRGGDGAGGPYDWDQMPLVPTVSMTLAQRQAIGALCYDAGVTVNMSYTAGASGANLFNVKRALTGTFGYTNAVNGNNSNNELGSALVAMVNPNLDAGLPVLLGISGTPGGHAVVVDGYGYNAATLYHHINMGWDGTNTAWYNLPTVDTVIGTFTVVQACIYNIYTAGTGEIISGRVLDAAGNPVRDATVTATRSAGGTYTAMTDARGIYALAKVPAASSYTLAAAKAGYAFSIVTTTTGTSSDYAAASGNRWGVDLAGGSVLPGDINLDSTVDVLDLLAFVGAFGFETGDSAYDPTCDLNGDGAVDTLDLLILANNWGRSLPASWASGPAELPALTVRPIVG